MAEPKSRRDQVVAAALDLLEAHGPEGLTMRAVAARVGIKAPSLYKHFPGKAKLETALIAEGFRETGHLLRMRSRAALIRWATSPPPTGPGLATTPTSTA